VTGDARFELERAITQNELELHYQPIFDISGDALRGVEALVRWQHPQKGLVSPQGFLPTAEREGLMHALTAWVLREALLQASVWRKDGLTLNMSVNIAASDLGDARFVRLLDRTLQITAGSSAFTAETVPLTGAIKSETVLTDSISPKLSPFSKGSPTSGSSTAITSPSSSWAYSERPTCARRPSIRTHR